MPYIENPKTKGSGIICAIPQAGSCNMGCKDCFFQSGRSYLEPLSENTPNMPSVCMSENRIVRVNDGNDSSNSRELVMESCKQFKNKFYNTSSPYKLEQYDAPVVLTVNPGELTCKAPFLLGYVKNLMFVRVRTVTWNLLMVDQVIQHYTALKIPVVLTFMAFYETEVPLPYSVDYELRRRTINEYFAIRHSAWQRVMTPYHDNPFVHSCGIEGVETGCKYCGNCLREYFATLERMKE